MKILIPFFVSLLFFASNCFSQSSDNWEDRADRWAEWAERVAESLEVKAEVTAEKLEFEAERTADNWEVWADEFADDFSDGFERTFDRNWGVTVNGERIFAEDLCSAYLGIHSDEISKEKARKLGSDNFYGSYITRVIDGSAAANAGLEIFDYVYGIDDQRTSNNQDLSDIISDYQPGDNATLHFIRNGQERIAEVTFGEYNDFNWNTNNNGAFLGIRPHDREDSDDLDGVTVEIVSNSKAEEMGLQDGDQIMAVNGHEILDWTDVSAAIDELGVGELIQISYLRDGQKMNSSAPLKAKQQNSNKILFGQNYEDWDEDGKDNWDDGDGAFMGIYTENISSQKARKLGYDNPYGIQVTGVIKGTGADRAGLQTFDYIFGVDEYRVGENQRLGGILRKYEIGDEATMHFYRKGKKQKTRLTFGSHADVKKEDKNKCEDPFFGIVQIHNGSSVDGVRIRPVRSSTASEMGLEEGDIITSINGFPMIDWDDISIGINMLSPGETISVDYIRDGDRRSASQAIKSYADSKGCENCDCDDNDDHGVHIDFDDGNVDIRIGGRNRSNNGQNTGSRLGIDDVDVNMESITSNDVSEMRGKGVDMPIENTLTFNSMDLSSNSNIGMFELEFDLLSEGNTLVRVFNPVGRVIYEYDLGRFSGDFADYIDISQNGEGIYYLQITQDENTFSRKIVLTKN